MAATIKIKNSSTASAVPTSSDLVQGELAVNVTDKRLFTENASGTVVELGTNPSSITLPDGSASSPTLTNDGDTNTGLFFPAADTVGVTTGGTERARIDSSGNLGLGVTPSAWGSGYTGLDIKYLGISNTGSGTVDCSFTQNGYYNGTNWIAKYTSPSKRYSISDSGHIWYNGASATAGSAITFTEAMRIDTSGNLGVGTSSPGRKLDVYGAAQFKDASGIANTIWSEVSTGVAGIGTNNNYPLALVTNGTERARIDTSGNLLVGTTSLLVTPSTPTIQIVGGGSGSATMYVRNSAATSGKYWRLGPDSSSGFNVYNQGNTGVNLVDGNTSWSAVSDERLKDIIEPISDAANKVSTIRAVIGKYKTDEADKRRSFLIAQDVQAVLPEAVNIADDEQGTLSLAYTDLIPLLTAALQELKESLDSVKAEFEAYKATHP